MNGVDFLAGHDDLIVKQTKRGACLQFCCNVDAKIESKIAPYDRPNEDIMYAIEESSCCIRYFCPGHHPFTMEVSQGAAPGGPKIISLERPCACYISPCKCCCFQQVDVKNSKNEPIGTVRVS